MNNIQPEITKIVDAVSKNKFEVVMQEDSFLRIQSVIRSCWNEEQLECCQIMIENFEKRNGDKNLVSLLNKEKGKLKDKLDGK